MRFNASARAKSGHDGRVYAAANAQDKSFCAAFFKVARQKFYDFLANLRPISHRLRRQI